MKKLLIPVVVSAAIVGGYYGTGVLTQSAVKRSLNIINQSNTLGANGLFVDLEHYDNGIFTSNAVLNWRLHVQERLIKENNTYKTIPAKDYSFVMPVTIYHGPATYANKSLHFGLGYMYSKIPLPNSITTLLSSQGFSIEDGNGPAIDLTAQVNYLRQTVVNFGIPKFKLKNKDHSKFMWHGLTITTELSKNFENFKGGFNFKGLKIKQDKFKMSIGKIENDYSFNLDKNYPSIYVGDVKFSLEKINAAADNDKHQSVRIFNLEDVDAKIKSEINEGLFSSFASFSIGDIFLQKANYGPMDVEMSIKNLDVESLSRINSTLNQIQTSNNNIAQKQQAIFSIMPELPKLLSKGAQFNISKLNVKMPQGALSGNVVISLAPGDSNDTNPLQLIQKIKGHGSFEIPKVLFRQWLYNFAKKSVNNQTQALQNAMINQMQTNNAQNPNNNTNNIDMIVDNKVSKLVQDGFISKKDNSYVIDFSLENGQFLINGNQYSPSIFQF